MDAIFKILVAAGRQRSVQVVLVIAVYLSIASSLPIEAHQGLYAISLFIKELLLWLLLITVSLFIAHAISSFEKQAPLFILSLFANALGFAPSSYMHEGYNRELYTGFEYINQQETERK